MGKVRKQRVKRRLFLGEGDFHYTKAYAQKHPEAIPNIVATEYQQLEALLEREAFAANYKKLKAYGVQTYFGVDAANLSHSSIPEGRFPRIQFNFPYIREDYKVSAANRALLDGVFGSASVKQAIGDRVHITLPKENREKTAFRYGFLHGVGDAAWKHGYRLIKKRRFNANRYPGYQHNQTGNSKRIVTEGREWVFKKIAGTMHEIEDMQNKFSPKRRRFQPTPFKEAKLCIVDTMNTSDEESSSGEWIDENQVLPLLMDKSRVANEAKILISEGYSEEVGQLLLEVCQAKGLNFFWDVDGGIKAMSILGDYFNAQHAEYIVERVNKNVTWRVKSVIDAIEVLSKSVTQPNVIQNIVTILASVQEKEEHFLEGVSFMKKYLSAGCLDEAVLHWFDSELKWWLHQRSDITLMDAVSNATTPLRCQDQLALLQALISSDDVLTEYIASQDDETRIYLEALTTGEDIPGYGLKRWFTGLGDKAKKSLVISALSDKSYVYEMTGIIQTYELLTPIELADALIIASEKATDHYWDIGPMSGRGGIEAMGLLGSAFDRRHAEYIVAMVKQDEPWRADSAITVISSFMQREDSVVFIELVNVIKQAFRLPRYIEQCAQIKVIPETIQFLGQVSSKHEKDANSIELGMTAMGLN